MESYILEIKFGCNIYIDQSAPVFLSMTSKACNNNKCAIFVLSISPPLRRSVSYTIRVDTHDVTCCGATSPFLCTHGTHVAEIECKLAHTRRILFQFHVVAAAFARVLQKMRHRKLARSFCPCFVMNEFDAAEFHMQPFAGATFSVFFTKSSVEHEKNCRCK